MLADVKTPSYVIDENKLIDNLKILQKVQKEAGCKILLAQKAFSNFALYPLIGEYLAGTTASGLYEARLGFEEMGKENHVFAPAYKEADIDELIKICDHIIFNSVNQLVKYKEKCLAAGVEIGLRVNPQCSTQEDHAIYDPCAKGSRLGVTADRLKLELDRDSSVLDGVSGLHFHTLCEQNSDDLETTLVAVKEKFGEYLHQMKWLNMGGGHHITRADYDIDRLVHLIKDVKSEYDLLVYLEPGEAVALNAGYFVTEVLDIVDNDIKTLILDGSAACHMPDVLEMPYRPPLRDSGEWGEKPFEYRLSSYTCLAGDIIGDYSFDTEIKIGDRLIFEDMAIYSMVKNNTFNGIPLPDIYLLEQDGTTELIKRFGYEDFKNRLS
ncbi:carboxynorspermidine decarboxylase [Pseudobutyrivibrio sp. ACV-2]|uniref:carboxynorspermidine decarboxylase n=1 Tax=Pseudobutyrivibrio sp. ACV-2 TaxID=1520801 RepID=UPI000898EBA3|nr:carboxynorspermidine decarboxylase [Pseudobutyrivibrio sp. ACV-2]SDZ88541.1 carboxynorspermidine decarboxylase [Pseudobutyrivibrio sp. ACV-2]